MALALLYQLEPETYYSVLAFMGFVPFRYPFLDLQGILASADCWQRGIDVYVHNPCDVLNRVFTFTPLWLDFLPGKGWTNVLGLCLTASFFLALAVLPAPRSGKELLARLVATLSPVTAFAVERGNSDLLMFVLATATGVFLVGPLRNRVVGYATIVIAGLLKVYPFVLMVLTLRERPRVFLLINGTASTVALVMGVYFHGELAEMLLNIPSSSPFSSAFGAHYLPDVIAGIVAKLYPVAWLGPVRLAIFAAISLAMAGWFFRVVSWRDLRVALTRLQTSEKLFLLIGAALISGCFFAGTNIGYRGIHLLFTLPGLFAMARLEADMHVRRMSVQGCALVVALTWVGLFMMEGLFRKILALWIGKIASVALVGCIWLLSQIAWYQVVTLFIAILIGSCSNWLHGCPGVASLATSRARTTGLGDSRGGLHQQF
jgi:hypothetical protein